MYIFYILIILCFGFKLSGIELNSKEEKKYKFYYFNPDNKGAHAFYNPINFIVQGGLPGGKNMSNVDFEGSTSELFDKLLNPVDSINNYGWTKFFYFEFIPHLGPGGNYTPNYIWHFLGGGFRTKLMEEYYTYYEYQYPKVWAWTTMYVLHFLNEISQISSFNKTNEINDKSNMSVDALADLLFFDWVGGVLFSFDCVNNFFTKQLHLTEWASQSLIDFKGNLLRNNGQLYWMRYEIFNPISINFLTGSPISALGLTFSMNNIHQFSFGFGFDVAIVSKNDYGDIVPSETAKVFGFYYSKNDNPFLTIVYRKGSFSVSRITLNLYPGVIKFNNNPLGFYAAYQKKTFFIGITNGSWPIGFTLSKTYDD